MSRGIPEHLLPKVTMYPCCDCCVAEHKMPHAEHCGKHQRGLVPPKTRRRRGVETIETTEAL